MASRLAAALRAARGEISQEAVAAGAGVSRTYYRGIERDGRVSQATLIRITEFLGADPIPLLVARAADRGVVEIKSGRGSRDAVLVRLALRWSELSEEMVAEIGRMIG